jgi:peptidoglycan/LPS O-acetylase OafA/YrhL
LIGIEQSAFRGPLAFIVPLAASILAAYLLYRLVELPARKWSKKSRYSGPRSRPLLAGIEEPIA